MNPVTLTGIVLGSLLLLTTMVVFLIRKDFPATGVGVSLVGVLLIGMSQWSSIKLSAGGNTLELKTLQEQVKQTAEAASEVATQATNAAVTAEATRRQVSSLASQLESKNVLTAQAGGAIRSTLSASPAADTAQIRSNALRLRAISKAVAVPQH